MRFHPEWRRILLRAWCVRFLLAAAALDGVAVFCGFFTDAPESVRPWFAGAGLVATVLAPIARLIPQDGLPGAAS